jgi:hypothetical protein
MRKYLVLAFALLLSTGSLKRMVAQDEDKHRGRPLRANLIGFQEVPAVSTTGKGTSKPGLTIAIRPWISN